MKSFIYQIFVFLFVSFLSMIAFAAPVTTTSAFDNSFGTSGVATHAVTGNDERIYASVEDSEGRILVTGSYDPVGLLPSVVFIARFLPNGAIDTSFGMGGVATWVATTNGDVMYAIGLQSDGKIIVAGRCHINLCVMRYDPVANSWDNSFGEDSPMTPATMYPPPLVPLARRFSEVSSEHIVMQIDPVDDSIILGATIRDYPYSLTGNKDFVFVKLNASGADIGFTFPGLLVHDVLNIHDRLGDLFLHGNVLFAGGVVKEGDDQDIVILAMDKSTGSPVTTYGNNGLVQLSIAGSNEYLYDLAFSEAHGLFFTGLSGDNLILGKFNLVDNNLVLDTSFGSGNGYVTALIYDVRARGHGIKFDNSDRVILQAQQSIPMETDQLTLMRFCASSGLLDTNFGDAGLIFHEDFASLYNTILLTNNSPRIIVGTLGRINNSTLDMVLLGYTNPDSTICPIPPSSALPPPEGDVDGTTDDTTDDTSDDTTDDSDGSGSGSLVDDGPAEDTSDEPGDESAAEDGGGCSCDFRQASAPLPLTPFLIFLGIAIISFLQLRKFATKRSKD